MSAAGWPSERLGFAEILQRARLLAAARDLAPAPD